MCMMIIYDTYVGIHIRIYNKEVLVMSASKDTKRGTWKVYIRYKDWQGIGQVHTKRGFATKREALEYEREFLLKKSKDVNMGFPQFVEVYMEDMKPRLKLNTFLTKKHIMETKIIPYFEKKSLAEITATDVIQWQNQLLSMRDENGMPYAQTYLRTIQNQLSAIFNHACRFYGLTANPSKQAGKMGKAKGKEMLFWTKEEYLKFSEVMKDKPVSYYAFEVLYWTGIREGDDDDKIRLNQRKPSKYKGLSRFGPEKNLQRINKFMKERPIFYKNLIQMKENIRFYLRCFYCITKVMILQFNSENRTELARNG